MPVVRKIRKMDRRDSAVTLRAAMPATTTAPIDPRLTAAVWHVWIEGGEPIGPVSADQLARGMKAGKVPSDASARHETETFWGDLLDIPDVVAALKAVSVESEPPPPPSGSISAEPSVSEEQLVIPQYLVWIEGSEPVGPVSADQVARGIRAGKVPADASIQRVGDLFSSDVLDEPDVIAALKQL